MSQAHERARELAAGSWLPGWVTPEYEGRCIANLPGSILRLFGGDALRPLPFPLPEGGRPPRRVALVVLDALGWHLFERALAEIPALRRLAERGRTEVLTSVFPSTTNVALTSLYSGLTPREHGLIGHLLYLRELGMSVDLLRFTLGGEIGSDVLAARGFKSRAFAGLTTLFQRLAGLGVPGVALTRSWIKGTPLAEIHHHGAEVIPFVNSSDMAVALRRLLERGDGPRFVFAYWDLIDVLSHLHRPDSAEVRAELAAIFFSLERELLDVLSPAVRAETLLLVVADHGQLPVAPEDAAILADYPGLGELLMVPPTGGLRYAYLHPVPGRERAVREFLEALPEQFLVLDAREAMERGLWGLGEPHPEALHRTGPLLALAQGHTRFYRTRLPEHLRAIQGIHGGLAPEEMLVPFVALPLEAW